MLRRVSTFYTVRSVHRDCVKFYNCTHSWRRVTERPSHPSHARIYRLEVCVWTMERIKPLCMPVCSCGPHYNCAWCDSRFGHCFLKMQICFHPCISWPALDNFTVTSPPSPVHRSDWSVKGQCICFNRFSADTYPLQQQNFSSCIEKCKRWHNLCSQILTRVSWVQCFGEELPYCPKCPWLAIAGWGLFGSWRVK